MTSPAVQKMENTDAEMIQRYILSVENCNIGSIEMDDNGTENLDHRRQYRHRA